jgi:hypothetical protein
MVFALVMLTVEELLVEGKLFVVVDENDRAEVACDCRAAGG